MDTGYAADRRRHLAATLAAWSGGAVQRGPPPGVSGRIAAGRRESRRADYADAFRARLADPGPAVVAPKSIAAYRCGFDLDWTAPSDADVAAEVAAWSARSPGTAAVDVTAAGRRSGSTPPRRAGLPIQLHVGLGDRDLDLHRVDPLLLLPLLRQPAIGRVPVMLLHCYPFHRQAGYLAQAFGNVYFDVGLAVNYLGARSVEVDRRVAGIGAVRQAAVLLGRVRAARAAPARLRAVAARDGAVLGRWVREGDWSLADALRVVRMIGRENASRVYAPWSGRPG